MIVSVVGRLAIAAAVFRAHEAGTAQKHSAQHIELHLQTELIPPGVSFQIGSTHCILRFLFPRNHAASFIDPVRPGRRFPGTLRTPKPPATASDTTLF